MRVTREDFELTFEKILAHHLSKPKPISPMRAEHNRRLQILRDHGEMTRQQFAKAIGVTPQGVHYTLKKLKGSIITRIIKIPPSNRLHLLIRAKP